MEPLFIEVSVTILGLIIGSFLTVCIFRIPYGKEKGPGDLLLDEPDEELSSNHDSVEQQPESERLSLVWPRRSFCPHCKAKLAWYHNLPLISWILLRGRCAHCHKAISLMYPSVEILSALCAWLCWTSFSAPTAVLVYIFCAALIVLSFIDAEYYILPNCITLPGIVIAAAIALINHYTHIFELPIVTNVMSACLGLLVGGGTLFLISEVYLRLRGKIGLGFGDVKLLTMTGLLFGPGIAFYTIFIGSLIGTVAGIGMMVFGGHKASHPLPFGPYLAIGTFVSLFFLTDLLRILNSNIELLMGWQ